ncbi:hypothetical protein FRC12_011973 [Ceratobasidium sp. 428]|nr:hypothetical protein FRC12_011973 [Ceratobasidium sp. 428]
MDPHKFDAEFDPEPETNLDHFARDWETERIVKPLLRDLEMPNVAHIELKLMKDRFICGRCTDTKRKTWVGLIYHFINALNLWEANKDTKSTHRTRHPIVFRNIHDLEPADESGPLARLLGESLPKTHQSESPPPKKPSNSDQLFCYLCEGTGRPVIQLNRADMLAHIRDWHNVQDPVEGIYFGREQHSDLGDKWHKIWDAFHESGEVTAGLSTGEL